MFNVPLLFSAPPLRVTAAMLVGCVAALFSVRVPAVLLKAPRLSAPFRLSVALLLRLLVLTAPLRLSVAPLLRLPLLTAPPTVVIEVPVNVTAPSPVMALRLLRMCVPAPMLNVPPYRVLKLPLCE